MSPIRNSFSLVILFDKFNFAFIQSDILSFIFRFALGGSSCDWCAALLFDTEYWKGKKKNSARPHYIRIERGVRVPTSNFQVNSYRSMTQTRSVLVASRISHRTCLGAKDCLCPPASLVHTNLIMFSIHFGIGSESYCLSAMAIIRLLNQFSECPECRTFNEQCRKTWETCRLCDSPIVEHLHHRIRWRNSTQALTDTTTLFSW